MSKVKEFVSRCPTVLLKITAAAVAMAVFIHLLGPTVFWTLALFMFAVWIFNQ